MNRFDRVVDILDRAVGGPSAPVGFHGPFWRGIGRNELVAKKVFGLQLISVGDGSGSILVKALKGEIPFGADTGQAEATFNRMPSGLPQVSLEDIAFVEKWIDDGCPEDELATPAPLRVAADECSARAAPPTTSGSSIRRTAGRSTATGTSSKRPTAARAGACSTPRPASTCAASASPTPASAGSGR